METRVNNDPKLAGAPVEVVGEAGTLFKGEEHQVVMTLPTSESLPARVMELVTPEVGQVAEKRKRRRQSRSFSPKLHPALKTMKEEEEEVCFICFDGGSLVLCDRKGCPKAYHPACIKRDDAFFQSKAKWYCGWHICRNCEKAGHYMCYTCTYSLCKRCTKDADYVCVRGNKGFCTICMRTIMMIENKDSGNQELIQVDFDDKTSWEYLFKVYWNVLKGKLSLSLNELTQAKNPCVGVIGTDFKNQIPEKDKSNEAVVVPIVPKSIEHSVQNPCRGVIRTASKKQISRKGNSSEVVAVPILPKTIEHSEQNPCRGAIRTASKKQLKKKDNSAEVVAVPILPKSIEHSEQNPCRRVIRTASKKQNPRKDNSTEVVVVPILPKTIEHSEQNTCRGVIRTASKKQIPRKDNSTEGVDVPILPKSNEHSEQEHQLPDRSSVIAKKLNSGKRKNSDRCFDWGSKELMEFVAHMKNGDTSILSRTNVQALLMEYITKNDLQDPHLKNQIVCDLRLKMLFGKSRVGHTEMLKLLEYHYLIKEDTTTNALIPACTSYVGDDHNNDTISNQSKRQKTKKKGEERALQVVRDEYAAIDSHNINLIFLRRSALENLIDEEDHFHNIVVGSIVRIRVPCNDQNQDFYRLVRVLGTSKGAEPYKVCDKDTHVMLEVLNLDKKETLSIDAISNQVFNEDECRRLRQSIKCGIVKPLTVGEIQMKAVNLQALRFDDWLISEILRLSHLRVRANEKGHKKEYKECVEKLKLLRTPELLHQKLTEIPEVHGDPTMNPNYQSEEDAGKNEKQKDEVSKLCITENHTIGPSKCVKENKATSTQRVQPKRDGNGSNSSSKSNHVLRPRKCVKVNKVTSAQRVQPKRGGSNSIPKQDHIYPGGSSRVVGNQSVLRPDADTILVQQKRDGGGSNRFPKQENDVTPGEVGSSVIRNQLETATVAPVSRIRVKQKRGGGGSNSFLTQENNASQVGCSSVPNLDLATMALVPPGGLNRLPKQENDVSPDVCSLSVIRNNQSVLRPDSETATVAPVSKKIRVKLKRSGGGESISVPKQDNHVSLGNGSSSVVGNQSVPMPDSETVTMAPVSKKIRVKLKRGGGGGSSSVPRQDNHVSQVGGSSSVFGNQSVLSPGSETATVGPVSRIRVKQKKDGVWSDSSPKKENHHVSPGGSLSIVGTQSLTSPDSDAVIRVQSQQKRDGDGSNNSPNQENLVSPNDVSSSVIGNRFALTSNSDTAIVASVSGKLLSNSDTQMEKLWHYRDPIGRIQGPFSMVQLQKWSTTGYFPTDMRIWSDNEQDHSVLLNDALSNSSLRVGNAAREWLDSNTCCTQSRVDQCSDLLKNVPVHSERPVVLNNLEQACVDPSNLVTKHGVEEFSDPGVNEHPNEAQPVLFKLDMNNKDCDSVSMTNRSESSENKGNFDLVNIPCPTLETDITNSESQPNAPDSVSVDLVNIPCPTLETDSTKQESQSNAPDSVSVDLVNIPCPTLETDSMKPESQPNAPDSMSVDIQDAELPTSLSGYVSVNGITVSDVVLIHVKNETNEDLPISIPKPSYSGDLCKPKQNTSDENQLEYLGWSSAASSQVVSGGPQMQETGGVWVSSSAHDEHSGKEWDFGLVPNAICSDEVAITTPNHHLLDCIDERIEFNTLAEESVSDLLAEVDAMESKSGLPSSSPSSSMRCGDDLTDRNDCFSSIEELSPNPDSGKSDAVSLNPDIQFPSQQTEIHDHDPIGASKVSVSDPLKRSTGPLAMNQPMVNAPTVHHGNVKPGWAGPPAPPQAVFANVSWRPSVTTPWVDSKLSLGAYNGHGGWDNSPHRFGGSRDYGVQGGHLGFGRPPMWSRQQHVGGGGGGGGGYSRASPKGQRVCKFYESGHCKKGAACSFLHP